MQETINEILLKKSKYDKDEQFVKLFDNDNNFLEDEKKPVPIKATFVEKRMSLIGQLYVVLTVPFTYCMQTWETLNF